MSHPRLTRLGVVALLLYVSLQGLAAAEERMTAEDIATLTAPAPLARLSYGPHALQFGHLRLPARPGPHPVVVFIHGGCWLAEYDLLHAEALMHALATAGFAVWSVEYRRVGDEGGGWPNTYLDVGLGIDHVRTLARTHEIDLERVVVAGHSAGGALALWSAARARMPEHSALYMDDPLPMAAVVALAPAADLEAVERRKGTCGEALNALMDGTAREHPARYAWASPMGLAPIDVPQVLVLGRFDAAWTPPALAYRYRAITTGSERLRVIELPESGHFEMIDPSKPAWPLVLAAFHAAFAMAAMPEPANGAGDKRDAATDAATDVAPEASGPTDDLNDTSAPPEEPVAP